MENPIPIKLWGKDSLYWSHVKLFVKDVLHLKNYPGCTNVYAISNHPIIRVLITGYVTMVDRRQKLTVYGVDDGTGYVPCCLWLTDDTNVAEADLGMLVTVMGKITTYRNERQITVLKLYIEKNANAEPLHWLEVIKLRDTYRKPFEFSDLLCVKIQKKHKPWLANELDIEIDSLQETLKKEIVQFLESSNCTTFTFEMLISQQMIMDKVKEISIKHSERRCTEIRVRPTKPEVLTSKKEIAQIVKDALRKLEREGVVKCQPIRTEDLNDVYRRDYEFIPVKEELAPRVLRAFKEITETQGESKSGVPISKVLKNLRAYERYMNIGRDRVAAAIEHLMTYGNIYQTREDYYRIV